MFERLVALLGDRQIHSFKSFPDEARQISVKAPLSLLRGMDSWCLIDICGSSDRREARRDTGENKCKMSIFGGFKHPQPREGS